LILPLFLWTTQLGFAIEAWRCRYGSHVRKWIEIAGEFDALCALAGFAYEHPGYPFPLIDEGEPYLQGDDLQHPLLPSSRCVPNSVRLGDGLQLLIVSGSNMSGKSTFLRTIGINLVLAQAGAPVAARQFRCSVMMIGATLRTQDSLRAGTSRFYAEVERLNDILNHAQGGNPVLFLLDEILHGTNSHDRVVGAEAILRAMLESKAIGVVTTHDLAIAEIAGRLGHCAANMHFQDRMENGSLVFDYLLHSGVVTRSNAIDLMRAAGLRI
jgi:DNA mismatch repair ATPase MutS